MTTEVNNTTLYDIFGIENILSLDAHLTNQIITNQFSFKIFIDYYQKWTNILISDEKDSLEKYIVNYGYILFLKANYDQFHLLSNNELLILLELLDYISEHGKTHFLANMFCSIETGLFIVDEDLWNWENLKLLIKYPKFQKHVIIINSEHILDFQQSRLLGKILSLSSTYIEKSNNMTLAATKQQELRIHILDIYNDLFSIYPNEIYDLFNNISKINLVKSNITWETYYNDKFNTYHFLENCLNVIFMINDKFSDIEEGIKIEYLYSPSCSFYKNNLETVSGIILKEDNNNFNNKTKWHFLVYSFYRILFYSLTLQNYNCINHINNLMLSSETISLYKRYFELNAIYLNEPYNRRKLIIYMNNFINVFEHRYLNEDLIYEIVNYYTFMIEYQNAFTKDNLSNIPISFFKLLIMDNDLIKNPHIKLRCFKILFLYEYNYENINLKDDFFKSLVDLSMRIDAISRLGDQNEFFNYNSNIIKMLTSKNYISNNKDFYYMIITQYENILSSKINHIKTVILDHTNGNLATIKAEYINLQSYLISLENLFLYLVKSNDSLECNIFNEKNIDLVYHFTKLIYCIFKHLYDNNSAVIKVKYTSLNDTNDSYWNLFVTHILLFFKNNFEKIFQVPNMINMISRFYKDIDIYLEQFDREFNTDYLNMYINLKSNENIEIYPNDLPDEFLDPILFTPISEPLILPESHIIIDKTIIMAQLLETKCDPFNRQPLTIEILNEYNNRDDIIEKCFEFIQKRNKWLTDNVKT